MTEDEMVGWHYQLNEHEFDKLQELWRTEEPGVLQFIGLQRMQQDLVTKQ